MRTGKLLLARRLTLLGLVASMLIGASGGGDDETCYELFDASLVIGEWVDNDSSLHLLPGDATLIFFEGGHLDTVIALPARGDVQWALVFELPPEEGAEKNEPQSGETRLADVGAVLCSCEGRWTHGYCEAEEPEACLPLEGLVEVSDVESCTGGDCNISFTLRLQAVAGDHSFSLEATRKFEEIAVAGSCSSGCSADYWGAF